MLQRLAPLAALAFAACGVVGGGSNVTYYRVAAGNSSALTGNDCPGVGNEITTIQGIDGAGTVAIYALPGSEGYVLDDGQEAISGTQSGGAFTFSGSELADTKGSNNSPEVQITLTITVSLTPQGSGLVGSWTEEQKCDANGTNANVGCQYTGVPQASSSYDCTASADVVAAQVPAPTQIVGEGTSTPGNPGF